MPPLLNDLLLRSPLSLLISLRWLAVAGQSVAVALVHAGFDMPLPLLPLSLTVLAQAVFNGWSMHQLARRRPGAQAADALALQFTFDTLALAVMLFFTGGAFNPFVSLFLAPLAIAAVMLPAAYTTCLVILTVFLYGSLLENSVPLPEPPPHLASQLSLHLFGMWVNFILSAGLIAGFVAYLSSRLRQSQQDLRQVREQNLRQEQILALGTLAAGTAHELGTPLATMAVVMADLEQDVPEPLKDEVRLVQQQIVICKDKLAQLVRDVRQGGSGFEYLSALAFAERVLAHFSLLRPAVAPVLTHKDDAVSRRVRVDRALEQALLNLVDNAADASPGDVALDLDVRDARVLIHIADRGPGFPDTLAAAAGRRILVSSADDGLGIGLLLSNATVERHGGEVRVTPRPGGGSLVTLSLPLENDDDG